MHLKQICVKNILSFESAEFFLGDYTVIVGPNNSGKTNLLRILEMVVTNTNFEYFELYTGRRLDPDMPSEMTLTLDLDESETRMAFECIFDMENKIEHISEQLKTLRVSIYWDKKQSERVFPKFVLYQFGDGYTIYTHDFGSDNILFDRRVILKSEDEYKRMIDFWKTADSSYIFGQVIEQFKTRSLGEIRDKNAFLRDVFDDKRFDLEECRVVMNLPMSIRRDSLSITPIASLLKETSYGEEGTNIPVGILLNRIFERGCSIINEIHLPIKELADDLAKLRNSYHAKYDRMRITFSEITEGTEVLVEQDGGGEEHIFVEESGKKYDIKDSASGYYALAYILGLLHRKPSGLAIIDEPEIHLHPQMASRLHHVLEGMASRNGVHIVVVTHSTRFVTGQQIRGTRNSKLIMVTRPDTVSLVHADTLGSEPSIKPHLINPEIFFGNGSLIVEGPSDYFVQRAISDFYDGWFEKHNIVLIDSGGKHGIPPQVDLHRRFGIPYYCMADGDFENDLDHITTLEKDLETELDKLGVENVREKEDYRVYEKMMKFLNDSNGSDLKKSGIWKAFEGVLQATGADVPS